MELDLGYPDGRPVVDMKLEIAAGSLKQVFESLAQQGSAAGVGFRGGLEAPIASYTLGRENPARPFGAGC